MTKMPPIKRCDAADWGEEEFFNSDEVGATGHHAPHRWCNMTRGSKHTCVVRFPLKYGQSLTVISHMMESAISLKPWTTVPHWKTDEISMLFTDETDAFVFASIWLSFNPHGEA